MRARSCSAASASEKRVDEHGQVRVSDVEVPIEEWSVCLPEHHPGYVSWDEYLATRERLRANVRPRGEGGGAAREGAALLQGLVRCGRCGRRMQVAYSGNGGKVRRYACVRGRVLHAHRQACQIARRRAAGQGGRRRVPGGGHPGRGRRDRRRDRASSRTSTSSGSPGSGSRVERAQYRGRPRAAPVRRLRAREPARRPHARTRARGRARRASSASAASSPRSSSARPAPLTDARARSARARSRATCRGCGTRRRRPTATARSCCAR